MRRRIMSDSRRRVVAVAISVFAFLAAATGDAQLRPKVRVLTNSTASVPPECAQGTVAPPPRMEVPQPASVSAAPTRGGLSTALRVAQQAAERNDYDAFKRSLAGARIAMSSYTRGGDRDAAQDVLAVDSDLEQVWDFAQTTRTGAFYNDDNRALIDIARRYGAPPPLHISGQTLYPTHELREIVTREASKRLTRIGIHVTSGSARPRTMIAERPPAVPRHLPAATVVEAQPSTTHSHSRTHRTTPRRTPRKTAPRVASATPAPVKKAMPAPQPTPPPSPQPVAPAPQPRVVTAKPTPAPAPQPATATTPAPRVAAAAPPPVTATTAPAPPVPAPQPVTATTASTSPVTATPTNAAPGTDTATTTTDVFSTATDTTATTSSSAPEPRPAPGRSNLALRIFVVLIAIGLLVALFRASS
jgi:hypothetical protein